MMKIAAVICEYNPFHNGHKHQLELIKRDFDAVLCVMSGSFTERGEIAVFDKWSRAKAAVSNGADLVLELGARYSLSSAQGFSEGAVETVIGTGIADALVFGSEANDIKRLSAAAEIPTEKLTALRYDHRGFLRKGCVQAETGSGRNILHYVPCTLVPRQTVLAERQGEELPVGVLRECPCRRHFRRRD